MLKTKAYQNLDKDIQRKIAKDCIDYASQNLEFTIPANLVCALYIFLALADKAHPLWLFAWCSSMVFITLIRSMIFLNYSKWSSKKTLDYLTTSIILSGISWGILGSLLMPYNNLLDQRIVIIIIISIASVEIDSHKSTPILSFLFLLLSLVPLNIWFMYQYSTSYLLLGLAFLTYTCFILLAFLRSYALLINNLILRYQNLNLIENLYINQEITESSERRFHSAFDFAAIGMALVSLDGRFLKVNKSLCQLVGYDEESLLNLYFQTITHIDDLEMDLKFVHKLLIGEIVTYQLEKRYIHKNQQVIWILLSVSLLRDKQNNPLYFIAQIQNIDAQKKAEQELKNLAYHDNLTGLANRKQLELFWDFALANAQRHNSQIAVLFLDLDLFKVVNDQYGHNIGDLLLKETALRLKSCTRTNDLAARLGGDEFIILLVDIQNEEQVYQIAQKILNKIAKPMQLQEQELRVTTSIGISIYPKNGDNLNSLLVKADRSLYEVKAEGKNNFKLSKNE